MLKDEVAFYLSMRDVSECVCFPLQSHMSHIELSILSDWQVLFPVRNGKDVFHSISQSI